MARVPAGDRHDRMAGRQGGRSRLRLPAACLGRRHGFGRGPTQATRRAADRPGLAPGALAAVGAAAREEGIDLRPRFPEGA